MNSILLTDYASPPGETLAETIDAMGLTQTELARRMDRPIKTINEIIQGKAALTADTALELERVLGVPASFWNGLEANYREHLARQRAAQRLDVDEAWLTRLPIPAMQKRGWITRTGEKLQLMDELLSFFGCTNVDAWSEAWGKPTVAYRKSSKLQSHPEALAAWLRKAELESRKQNCAPFDAVRFKDALQRIRAATLLPVPKWQSEIRSECTACGVAYVILPELPGAPVSGAARQMNDELMLIVQSGRFKEDGHFWFTFFHEARHVLQGRLKREWLIEEEERDEPIERDANQFAREFLVPAAAIKRIRQKYQGMPLAAGEELARELGISPGIVAGRLQYDKIWLPPVAHKLKRRFKQEELVGFDTELPVE
jgi:addiction module HigA family antidote